MPVYNEEEGILEFVLEISNSLREFDVSFFIFDDNSTDSTFTSIQNLYMELPKKSKINVCKSEVNRGHGPTFISACRQGMKIDFDYLITTDGDGQFNGNDFKKALTYAIAENSQIIECVRKNRNDPLFRLFVTFFTRLLVALKTGSLPRDANTPMRVYKKEIAEFIFEKLEDDEKIPNLHISILSRRHNVKIASIDVQSLPRRGKNSVGTMWNTRINILPGKRFLQFCFKSFFDYIRF